MRDGLIDPREGPGQLSFHYIIPRVREAGSAELGTTLGNGLLFKSKIE